MAIEIAQQRHGEIVSVDSMQVYRGLDIGTAKASPVMQKRVAHHLLDLVEPEQDYTVAEFQREGRTVLEGLAHRDTVAVICGGSGLHFRSLVDPLEFPPHDESLRIELEKLEAAAARERLLKVDPNVAVYVDMDNPRRVVRALEIASITGLTPSERAQTPNATAVRSYKPAVDFVAIGVDPGQDLAVRVEQRFDRMLGEGLVDEVRRLQGSLGRLAGQAVGYKELAPVLAGEQTLAAGRAAAIRASMALAKRQRTFFRRDPRIHWITWDPDPEARLRSALDRLDRVMQ
jgi:tRNA dimethylallyltransferase